jgi:predicted transcriptional regulator
MFIKISKCSELFSKTLKNFKIMIKNMGRTPYRHFFTHILLSVLDVHIPSNVEAIKRAVSIKIGKEVSWNTVKKYLEELVEEGKIEKIKAGKILMYKKKIL